MLEKTNTQNRFVDQVISNFAADKWDISQSGSSYSLASNLKRDFIKRKYQPFDISATNISQSSLSNLPRETIQILVCGDQGAGKTTFMKELINSNKVSRVIRGRGWHSFTLHAQLKSHEQDEEFMVEFQVYEVNEISVLSRLSNHIKIVYLIFDLSIINPRTQRTMQNNLKRWVIQLQKYFPNEITRAFANKNDLTNNSSTVLSDLADLNGVLGQARISVESISAKNDGKKIKQMIERETLRYAFNIKPKLPQKNLIEFKKIKPLKKMASQRSNLARPQIRNNFKQIYQIQGSNYYKNTSTVLQNEQSYLERASSNYDSLLKNSAMNNLSRRLPNSVIPSPRSSYEL